MATPRVHFITSNANKLREVKAILEPAIQVLSCSIDLEEVQGSLEEVTLAKCRRAADIMNGPVLVEDTALCYKALGGLPGVYIKWFLAAISLDGLNKLIAGFPDKSAEAVCTFCYLPGKGLEPILFQGRCQGKIVPARGPLAFGWDPIFEYNGKTFAEMEPAEKNRVSHRGKALLKLQQWFQEHINGI